MNERYTYSVKMLRYWITVLSFAAIAHGIVASEFYPFFPGDSKSVLPGDSTSSAKISLSVPVKFYDREYTYLWVRNTIFRLTFVFHVYMIWYTCL